jgi:hypothetical protein
MLEKTVKIEPKVELKTSKDCPEIVVKEENDCEIIDIIYDSDIEIIDKSTECLKSKQKNLLIKECLQIVLKKTDIR